MLICIASNSASVVREIWINPSLVTLALYVSFKFCAELISHAAGFPFGVFCDDRLGDCLLFLWSRFNSLFFFLLRSGSWLNSLLFIFNFRSRWNRLWCLLIVKQGLLNILILMSGLLWLRSSGKEECVFTLHPDNKYSEYTKQGVVCVFNHLVNN